MRSLFGISIWQLVLALVLITSLHAQDHTWQTTEICRPCRPESILYADSARLAITVRFKEENLAFYTTDAGNSWHASTMDTNYNFISQAGFQFYTFFPPSTFYVATQSIIFVSRDAGASWEARSPLPNTFAFSMFREDFGYRAYKASGQIVNVRESRDSGYFFIDDVTQWQGLTSFVHFFDSTRFVLASGRQIFRTWDKGITWDTIRPMDTVLNPRYLMLHPTRDTSRFYVIGGIQDSSNLLRTTDGGATWMDFGPLASSRILRVAEQGEDSIWLSIARLKTPPEPSLFSTAVMIGRFADTLKYTTNGGDAWNTDLTFAGDTICDIQFHSPTDGFVISLRDSTVKFSRYVPGSSGIDGAYSYDGRGMHIHPNPASGELKFYARLGGKCQVRILDVLGRMVYEEPKDLVHSQWSTLSIPDHLPDGVYFLELSRGDAKAGQRFVIQR